MKIVYMGTPDFAVLPLERLAVNGENVIAVATNVDKPVGRKQILTPSPVKQAALKLGIPVFTYKKIREEGVQDLKALAPDLIITCAFGQILSEEILNIPRLGVINIHASLLPKYRGASPVHYAILNGEKETGVSIMKTDVGIDTGDVILTEKVSIGEEQTCGELLSVLSKVGADAVIKALNLIENGEVLYKKQDDSLSTYTKMIKKEHALIDWTESAERVKNQIRAFNPSPVAYTFYGGELIKIYKAQTGDGKGEAGEVLDSDGVLEIACGEGSVFIKTIQKAGGKPMDIGDFLRGNRIKKGEFMKNA